LTDRGFAIKPGDPFVLKSKNGGKERSFTDHSAFSRLSLTECGGKRKAGSAAPLRLQDAVVYERDGQKENGLEIHRHGENLRIESASCAGELPTVDLLGL
jgi:hypothetical protein